MALGVGAQSLMKLRKPTPIMTSSIIHKSRGSQRKKAEMGTGDQLWYSKFDE